MKDDTKAIYEKAKPEEKCALCGVPMLGSKYRQEDKEDGDWICAKCYYNE